MGACNGTAALCELEQSNECLLLAMRQMALTNPVQASFFLGMPVDAARELGSLSLQDIKAAARSGKSLFRLVVDPKMIREIASQPAECVPILRVIAREAAETSPAKFPPAEN